MDKSQLMVKLTPSIVRASTFLMEFLEVLKDP